MSGSIDGAWTNIPVARSPSKADLRGRIAELLDAESQHLAELALLRAENAALVADNARLMGMLEGEP